MLNRQPTPIKRLIETNASISKILHHSYIFLGHPSSNTVLTSQNVLTKRE